MRDMLDTLTRGPFRDDTHRAAVEAAAEDLAPKSMAGGVYEAPELRRAAEKYRQAPAEPVGGKIKTDARVMRVEVEAGRVRAAQAPLPEVDITPEGIRIPVSLAWQGAAWDLGCIYDAATRALASAGPLPLASTEPWSESDQEYRAKLADYLGYDVTYSGSMLDDYGVDAAGLPRPRLVPAITKER